MKVLQTLITVATAALAAGAVTILDVRVTRPAPAAVPLAKGDRLPVRSVITLDSEVRTDWTLGATFATKGYIIDISKRTYADI